MINNAEIVDIEIRMAEHRMHELTHDLERFVGLLEQYSFCPSACPIKEMAPYLEAYRFLKGNTPAFLNVLLDDNDPRQQYFELVADACERYNLEHAFQLIQETHNATGSEEMADSELD